MPDSRFMKIIVVFAFVALTAVGTYHLFGGRAEQPAQQGTSHQVLGDRCAQASGGDQVTLSSVTEPQTTRSTGEPPQFETTSVASPLQEEVGGNSVSVAETAALIRLRSAWRRDPIEQKLATMLDDSADHSMRQMAAQVLMTEYIAQRLEMEGRGLAAAQLAKDGPRPRFYKDDRAYVFEDGEFPEWDAVSKLSFPGDERDAEEVYLSVATHAQFVMSQFRDE